MKPVLIPFNRNRKLQYFQVQLALYEDIKELGHQAEFIDAMKEALSFIESVEATEGGAK